VLVLIQIYFDTSLQVQAPVVQELPVLVVFLLLHTDFTVLHAVVVLLLDAQRLYS